MGSGISTRYEKTQGLKTFEEAKEQGNKVVEVKNTILVFIVFACLTTRSA